MWNCSPACSKWYFCFTRYWSFYCTPASRFFSSFWQLTIDHSILLNRLKHWFGVSSAALNLLSLFFSGRFQVVVASNFKSQPNLLEYGIPLGNVLGPLFYSLYTTPLFPVIFNHPGIQCNLYADDTQIYLSFSPELASSTFSTIKSCIRVVVS